MIAFIHYDECFQYPELTVYMLTFRKDSVNPTFRQKTARILVFLYKNKNKAFPRSKDVIFILFFSGVHFKNFPFIILNVKRDSRYGSLFCFYSSSLGIPL